MIRAVVAGVAVLHAVTIDPEGSLKPLANLRPGKRGDLEGRQVQHLDCHPMESHRATVATASANGKVTLFEVGSKHKREPMAGGHSGKATRVKWHLESPSLLASGGDDGCVMLWDTRTESTSRGWAPAPRMARLRDMAWAPTGTRQVLAAAWGDGVVSVLDLRSSRPLWQFQSHMGPCQAVAWHPTWSGVLASGGRDSVIRLWDVCRDGGGGLDSLASAAVDGALPAPAPAAAASAANGRTADGFSGAVSRWATSWSSPHRRSQSAAVPSAGAVHAATVGGGGLPAASSSTRLAGTAAEARSVAQPFRLGALRGHEPVGCIRWRPGAPLHIAASSLGVHPMVSVWDVARPGVPVARFDRMQSQLVVADAVWVPRDDLHATVEQEEEEEVEAGGRRPAHAAAAARGGAVSPPGSRTGLMGSCAMLIATTSGRVMIRPTTAVARPCDGVASSGLALSPTAVSAFSKSIRRADLWPHPSVRFVDMAHPAGLPLQTLADKPFLVPGARSRAAASPHAASTSTAAPGTLVKASRRPVRVVSGLRQLTMGLAQPPPRAAFAPELVFRQLALGYRLEGWTRGELCEHNARVASDVGAAEAALVWRAVGALLPPRERPRPDAPAAPAAAPPQAAEVVAVVGLAGAPGRADLWESEALPGGGADPGALADAASLALAPLASARSASQVTEGAALWSLDGLVEAMGGGAGAGGGTREDDGEWSSVASDDAGRSPMAASGPWGLLEEEAAAPAGAASRAGAATAAGSHATERAAAATALGFGIGDPSPARSARSPVPPRGAEWDGRSEARSRAGGGAAAAAASVTSAADAHAGQANARAARRSAEAVPSLSPRSRGAVARPVAASTTGDVPSPAARRSASQHRERDTRVALRQLRHRLVSRVLDHCSERGDVQLCVTLVRVLGRSARRIAGRRRLERWADGYVDTLHRLKLWGPASTILARSTLPSLYKQTTTMTRVNVSCARCRDGMTAPLQPPRLQLPSDDLSSDDEGAIRPGTARAAAGAGGPHAAGAPPPPEPGSSTAIARPSCDNCRRVAPLCAVCEQPVSGLFVWCQCCGHGGHLEHMQEWFATTSTLCPTGCGHACDLRPLLGYAGAAGPGAGGPAVVPAAAPLSPGGPGEDARADRAARAASVSSASGSLRRGSVAPASPFLVPEVVGRASTGPSTVRSVMDAPARGSPRLYPAEHGMSNASLAQAFALGEDEATSLFM